VGRSPGRGRYLRGRAAPVHRDLDVVPGRRALDVGLAVKRGVGIEQSDHGWFLWMDGTGRRGCDDNGGASAVVGKSEPRSARPVARQGNAVHDAAFAVIVVDRVV